MVPLRILTWHTHGAYLYYLTQTPHEFYVLSKPGRPPGYGGRGGHIQWGGNVHDLPVEEVRHQALDCILFQDDHQYFHDQYKYLSAAQRRLPRVYIEHDPPRDHPTDLRHPVDDPDTLLVHVTPFNQLMWDSGRTPNCVIEHGVIPPPRPLYSGALGKGIVVINQLASRGRRLGADIYRIARQEVDLDLIGMESEQVSGLGEVRHHDLSAFIAQYRYFFNPIRYTSLGLAVIEAMMVGMPIVGLATTEMATAIEHGVSGYIDTDLAKLVPRMKDLTQNRELARTLGLAARQRALERFHIRRFVADWDRTLKSAAGRRTA